MKRPDDGTSIRLVLDDLYRRLSFVGAFDCVSSADAMLARALLAELDQLNHRFLHLRDTKADPNDCDRSCLQLLQLRVDEIYRRIRKTEHVEECDDDDEPGAGWSCVDGTCEEVAEGAEYPTQDECEANCPVDEGWDCTDGECLKVAGGAFTTFEECAAECDDPTDTGWNCQSGACIEASGGTYGTFEACAEECDDPDDEGWNCQSGACIQQMGGEFGTFEECVEECDDPDDMGWNCQSGSCIEQMGGQYGTFEECVEACDDPDDMGWDCVEDDCVEVEGGQYGTEQACIDAGCGVVGYNCVDDTCVGVLTGTPDFPTLEDCQAECPPPLPWECVEGECIEQVGGSYATEEECVEAECYACPSADACAECLESRTAVVSGMGSGDCDCNFADGTYSITRATGCNWSGDNGGDGNIDITCTGGYWIALVDNCITAEGTTFRTPSNGEDCPPTGAWTFVSHAPSATACAPTPSLTLS